MKVILKQDVKNLGNKDEVKEVKEGYARNYLIPKGLAEKATKNKLKEVEKRRQEREQQEEKEVEEAEKLKEKLAEEKLVIKVKTGDEGKLFGSVTNKDISEKLQEDKNIQIDKRKIELDDPIKDVGSYEVDIKLHTKVEAKLKVEVTESE
ncbi:50S ribosomal protein L9 [Natranaerofaba carboxydovora]|uniref:50S ribosomal protein L9 n=1 Tax=Natranaerofaba carboxydovora TaxID=2742683 RepID=UPI001F13C8F4|nr:50S ribosomal protein L9 [Natranaerofaba carboxydovora]UMZ75163.1 50S ribosomal protein L9 [Natranaerofaba carboxydovora]